MPEATIKSCCHKIEATEGQTDKSDFWKDPDNWKRASKNTLNCLIGCSIGDFGTIIWFQHYSPETNIFLVMSLAMAMGLLTSITLETIILKIKEHFTWVQSFKTAFSMSFLSMLGMEFSENATDYFLTKGEVGLDEPFFWVALGIALIVGFIVPLPYNYYKLKKHGKACH